MSVAEHAPTPVGNVRVGSAIDNKLAATQRSDKGAKPNASREEAN